MKTLKSILFFILLSATASAESVSLTDAQFKNLEKINDSLKEKYPQYKGFSGSKESLEVYGINTKSFMAEAHKTPSIDDLIADEKAKKREERLIEKRIRKLAIEALKADGVELTKVKE